MPTLSCCSDMYSSTTTVVTDSVQTRVTRRWCADKTAGRYGDLNLPWLFSQMQTMFRQDVTISSSSFPHLLAQRTRVTYVFSAVPAYMPVVEPRKLDACDIPRAGWEGRWRGEGQTRRVRTKATGENKMHRKFRCWYVDRRSRLDFYEVLAPYDVKAGETCWKRVLACSGQGER